MRRRRRADAPADLLSMDQWGEINGTTCDVFEPSPDPEARLIDAVLRRSVYRALRTLPAPYRAVLFLREIESLSTRETASVLGVSESNVKVRLFRARAMMREALMETGDQVASVVDTRIRSAASSGVTATRVRLSPGVGRRASLTRNRSPALKTSSPATLAPYCSRRPREGTDRRRPLARGERTRSRRLAGPVPGPVPTPTDPWRPDDRV